MAEGIVLKLEEVQPWCLAAKPGDQAEFMVAEEVDEEKASKVAFELNQKLDGHVWIDVKDFANMPEPTTLVHLRYTH